MPQIHVAHSPDSDDAFMFYALARGKIDTGDREYVHELADIETLNQRAMRGELEVTAVSIHAYAHIAERYMLLPHGASMGNRYGPRLVSTAPRPDDPRQAIRGRRIAVPGLLTTAYLALRLYQPEFEPVETPFDRIEQAVKSGDVDLGMLIHEGQLTYSKEGLHLWEDMGEWWYGETGLPLPLGGNVVRRDVGGDLIHSISRDLKASIVYGLKHREDAMDYALEFARGLERNEADEFVSMYVNDFTVDYGESGRRGIIELLERAADNNLIPRRIEPEFAPV